MIETYTESPIQIVTDESSISQGAELATWLKEVPGIPAVNGRIKSQFQSDGRTLYLGTPIDTARDWMRLNLDWRNLETVAALFEHISGYPQAISPPHLQDIYVSAGFKDNQLLARIAAHPQVRLVGLSPTQLGIPPEDRFESMLESCSAYLAKLPHRNNPMAIERINEELAVVHQLGIPALVLGEEIGDISANFHAEIIWGNLAAVQSSMSLLEELIHEIFASWRPAQKPHYAFYATSMSAEHTKRNHAVRRVMEAAAQMPCVLGSEIRGGHVQQQITEMLRQSRLIVANISEGNQNVLVESGIALGAKRDLYLLSNQTKIEHPFMLRDQQRWYYQDEVDLLGVVYKISLPYRRKVLFFPRN